MSTSLGRPCKWLNGDEEYTGGRLAFSGVLEIPSRPSGSMTIHEGNIAHGVTELQSGVRYGLFLLMKEDESGRRGNGYERERRERMEGGGSA